MNIFPTDFELTYRDLDGALLLFNAKTLTTTQLASADTMVSKHIV